MLNHNYISIGCAVLYAITIIIFHTNDEKDCEPFPQLEIQTCVPKFEYQMRLGQIPENPLHEECTSTPFMHAFMLGDKRLVAQWLQNNDVRSYVKHNDYFRPYCCLQQSLQSGENTDLCKLV